MKIYVDKLPKNCSDCEFGDFYDCQYCYLRPDLARLAREDFWVEKEKHCPLLSIESIKQQVRKEVCEKIKEQLIKRLNIIAGYGKMTTDELSFFIETEFGSDLDTILKEYQK